MGHFQAMRGFAIWSGQGPKAAARSRCLYGGGRLIMVERVPRPLRLL